ncbi:hypothetical protein [Streptomyces sp. NBC_01264]|uniref:hypothetical protein n=1 Tax=Streptomyces sp. NBC_01264 TaxID=2903804 RepID=UPI0022592282|nr:hypothetical protein [Streptomyces sp. NBC_01264]MCX4778054.1 hypothetical protein [Streptomyces sp. NBC_01264]
MSSIPALLGDRGTELRADSGALVFRRLHEEVRIPLAAVARVHARGRAVAVELRVPAGTRPVPYRIGGVGRASAAAFAAAVNGSVPQPPAGRAPADGSALVTVTPRDDAVTPREGTAAAGEEDAEQLQPAEFVGRCAMAAAGLGLVALAARVVIAGDHVSRALAVLLLGVPVLLIGRLAVTTVAMVWNEWYLPRHGITTEARPLLIHGQVAYGYTATDGRIRPAPTYGAAHGTTFQVAYHPKYPARAVVFGSPGQVLQLTVLPTVFVTVTALLCWATLALAQPAAR